MPIHEFRNEAKRHLQNVLVSFKAKNKVVTRNKNRIKLKGKENYFEQIVLTPRGQLHKETVYGKKHHYKTKKEKIGTSFDADKISHVANKKFRDALFKRLSEFDGDPKKAFGGKNSPSKNPVYTDAEKTLPLPEKVKLVYLKYFYTIRKDISPDLKIEKVVDEGIKRILKNRLQEYNGDAKKAFSDLDKKPIWLNKEEDISIRRVTISGVANAEPLHYKKDHFGDFITDEDGNKQPIDYVSTGNNHHVAIYIDENGELHDNVISFFEAVERVKQGLPVIDKTYNSNLGWKFIFSMKQNEYFIFPDDNFYPDDYNLFKTQNYHIISPNLFRSQKFSKVTYGNSSVRDYVFRHHLETQIIDNKKTKNITYKVIKSLPYLENIVKVRINHLGKIVNVGE